MVPLLQWAAVVYAESEYLADLALPPAHRWGQLGEPVATKGSVIESAVAALTIADVILLKQPPAPPAAAEVRSVVCTQRRRTVITSTLWCSPWPSVSADGRQSSVRFSLVESDEQVQLPTPE